MSERRNFMRRVAFCKGIIIPAGGATHCPAVVRDYSAGGARLTVDEDCLIPDEFLLDVPARREMRQVRVRWRRPGLLGVMFLSEPLVRPKGRDDLMERLGAYVGSSSDEATPPVATAERRPEEAEPVLSH
jgi:hypothetical protein